MRTPLDTCQEWRLLASCELDGEMSELDVARLRGHLDECSDCVRWVAETESVTELLRAAELVPVEREIGTPVLRRRLSRASGLVGAGASAVAAAAAAALVGLPSGTQSHSSSLPEAGPAYVAGSGCTTCAESPIVLTAFKQALIVPWPSGIQNPSVEIE